MRSAERAHPFVDAAACENAGNGRAVALAPRLTVSGGLSALHPSGLRGGLRGLYIAKRPATELTGAAYFDSASSFAMIRGGFIDVAVLGALEVSAGGVTALLGPNGAGKSSLVLAIGGVLKPTGGSVTLDGPAYNAMT